MTDTLTDILQSVDELSVRGRVNRSRAFAAWFAITFFDLDEDDALEAAAADGGNDQGIDLVFADENSQELVVLQAYCPENFGKKTPKSKWDAAISSLAFVRNPESLIAIGRGDLSETIVSAKQAHPDYTISLGLVSLGLNSPEIAASVTAHQKDVKDKSVSFFYNSQEEILTKYQALVDSEAGIPEEKIEFSGGHIEDKGEYGRAWIGSISASELQRLHKAHGDRLFSGNIRLFLGARKGGINEQIIKTAKEDPGIFWALNNGITIVADSVSVDGAGLNIKRFSIVNGCQTTSSLVRAEASVEAKVLLRVIAAKSSLRNEIVRYNNSQNAVKIWTVRAADSIQEQLRADFKAAKIEYAPKQQGSRKRKSRKTIELDKVTQYLASSETSFLIQAIDNKSELFDEPYQKLFRRGILAKDVYLAWLVGHFADEERQSLLDGLPADPNAGLLSVTSGYWIVYCAFKLLARFSNFQNAHVTLLKMTSKEFENALRKYLSKAAELYFDAAIDTYDKDEYGSFKSTLRSVKFLSKIDSKLNSKVSRLPKKSLPDLSSVCRSAKM